jgi:hypothetical protein
MVSFGNKSKEQMTSLFRKARDSLTPQAKNKSATASRSPHTYSHLRPEDVYPATDGDAEGHMQRANSDPDVMATLKSILKGKSSKGEKRFAHPPEKMHHARDLSGSSTGYDASAYKYDERMDLRALAQQYNYDMPPRPSRRKDSITHGHGRQHDKGISQIHI